MSERRFVGVTSKEGVCLRIGRGESLAPVVPELDSSLSLSSEVPRLLYSKRTSPF